MRVVGGKYKGRVLNEFKGKDVRPTSDMARESLFNILRNKVIDCSFLDVFSGTGAVGIEAFSRGAKKVVLNDISRDSVRIISENLKKLGIENSVSVFNKDGLALLDQITEKFDIVYLDPPYKSDVKVDALKKVIRILNDEGLCILEDESFFEDKLEGLVEIDRRKYGRVHLTFFTKEK